MNKLYKNWPVHNIIGHPFMQIFEWCGMCNFAKQINDSTLPQELENK